MDLYLLWVAFLLGIIEGATEFLPVSSTGHLIIAADFLNFSGTSSEVFEIFIQLGAILAVITEYRKKLTSILCDIPHESAAQQFVVSIGIAFIPAAMLGFFFHSTIKVFLFNPVTVAFALIIGGVIMIVIEKRIPSTLKPKSNVVSFKHALFIGLAQCFSLIPGVSRAASTIMGGILCGLDRKTATEFSFFLAIPIIFAASFYDLIMNFHVLDKDDFLVFLVGFVTAYISALLVIRIFIKYVAHNNFIGFGWYRIIIGLITLLYFY